MAAKTFPVTISGSGTATFDGDGLAVELGTVLISTSPGPVRAPAPNSGGPVFPNYGRSKGCPIAGASKGDLEFYANNCRRTLADPGKAKWHDKERSLLAQIESEMARQAMPAPGPDSGYEQVTNTGDDIPF